MSRLSRINTIWRKELIDTLRDRRTLIAMILVPMALYPAMILGSLQGFEYQIGRLKQEEYRVVVGIAPFAAEEEPPADQTSPTDVPTPDAAAIWLRTLIDSDLARRPGAASQPAEVLVAKAERGELPAETQPAGARGSTEETARADVRQHPPRYVVDAAGDLEHVKAEVRAGTANVGVVISGPLPSPTASGTTRVLLLMDQTDIRSEIASAGLQAILERAGKFMLGQRLARANLPRTFIAPVEVIEESTAPPEKVGGSILGQIVPLILIIMTITGAIYPAIDLTAGERERGTLETLMVAPVPTVDLIAGKFVVVALIGMMSAALNLLSIGGTIYLGGLGELLTRGNEVVIPLGALPWVLLLLVPLAVLFSALLLAVCSFARSFKEAQNYVMPVMVAALIPAVVGVLPGTRLEGPLLIMPVTNIVVLTRDLFMGKFDPAAIIWVTVSTTVYAAAAVAVAARLFGQEAVLFADTGSVKTLFQRRFFKPTAYPSAAQALLIVALVFSLNFFAQNALLRSGALGSLRFWFFWAGILITLFVLLPLAAAVYTRAEPRHTFAWKPAPAAGWLAAACFGISTWILALALFALQNRWMPMSQELQEQYQIFEQSMGALPLLLAVLFMGLLPGFCEEWFFRGYVLSGVRGALGKWPALLIVALAFGVNHHSIFRLAITTVLGILFGLLVVQYRAIGPAMLAHALHNSISIVANSPEGLQPHLARLGFVLDSAGAPPIGWVLGAVAVTGAGVLLCLAASREKGLETVGGAQAY